MSEAASRHSTTIAPAPATSNTMAMEMPAATKSGYGSKVRHNGTKRQACPSVVIDDFGRLDALRDERY
jgi:hypothetical protein